MSETATALELYHDLEAQGMITRVGMHLPRTITRDQYEAFGGLLGETFKGVQWTIGDYINEGESIFGHEAYQLSESLGISEESRMQYARVAMAIPLEARRDELSWSHHRAVYSREPEERDALLEQAVAHGWTKRELEGQFDARPWKPNPAAVLAAALDVWQFATATDEDEYLVPGDVMRTLGRALGGGERA